MSKLKLDRNTTVPCKVLGVHNYDHRLQMKPKFIVQYKEPNGNFIKEARIPSHRLSLQGMDKWTYESELKNVEL